MTSTLSDRRAKLLEALQCLTPVMRRRLAQLKANADLDRQRRDLVWYLLLASAATLGNAAGFSRLFDNRDLAEATTYAALARLKPAARRRRLLKSLKAAGVRYASKKAAQLAANLERIEQRGGVELETRRVFALHGSQAKRDYFLEFAGIGPKYANNVWMDIYDPDFRDCVAVDARLKTVMRALELPDDTDPQQFFQQLASDAQLQAWEVDRLLFWFTDYFLAAVRW